MSQGTDMNTRAAVARREKLEGDILALLLEFHDATGLSPCGIDVRRDEYTSVGQRGEMYVTEVRVRVEL